MEALTSGSIRGQEVRTDVPTHVRAAPLIVAARRPQLKDIRDREPGAPSIRDGRASAQG